MQLFKLIEKLSDSANIRLYDYDYKLIGVYDGKNSIDISKYEFKDIYRIWVDGDDLCVTLVYWADEDEEDDNESYEDDCTAEQ